MDYSKFESCWVVVNKGQENTEIVNIFTTGSLVPDLYFIYGEWLKRRTIGSKLIRDGRTLRK